MFRTRFADLPRESNRPSTAGQQAVICMGVAKSGRVRGNDEITAQHQFQAAGERKAVDRRNYRKARRLDPVKSLTERRQKQI
jgi:hypothetical protein